MGSLQSTQARIDGEGLILTRPAAPVLLAPEHESEVLTFLGRRSTRTFGMVGFILDNGLVSSHNRGQFYGCRDEEGQLEGVALIGHATLFEARSSRVIEAFARLAQERPDISLILGEKRRVRSFWNYYSQDGQPARLRCRELLFEQRQPLQQKQPIPGLRLANVEDLDLIVPAHAQTVVEGGGLDPLKYGPEAFKLRCKRRIEKGKTWVWIDHGKLIFKAEILTNTPDVNYLEGVWVDPQERGHGHGLRCIVTLSEILLRNTSSICLLVKDKAKAAQAFYRKAGYQLISHYETVFFER